MHKFRDVSPCLDTTSSAPNGAVGGRRLTLGSQFVFLYIVRFLFCFFFNSFFVQFCAFSSCFFSFAVSLKSFLLASTQWHLFISFQDLLRWCPSRKISSTIGSSRPPVGNMSWSMPAPKSLRRPLAKLKPLKPTGEQRFSPRNQLHGWTVEVEQEKLR